MTRSAPYFHRSTCCQCEKFVTCSGDVGPSCTNPDSWEYGHLLSRQHQACGWMKPKVDAKSSKEDSR